MSRFCRRSGKGNSIFLSRRPGLNNAGSRVSARFVAMMTFTVVSWSKPSIWLSNSRRMRWTSRSAPVWESKRLVPIASISSMNTMAGAFSRARRNTSRTMRGPSPKYFCTNSEPTMRMNVAVVWFATAFASIVFPVPGGPYNSTPLGGSMPICAYNSLWVSGSSTASLISCFWMSIPPMSAYVTSGFSDIAKLCTVLSASGGKISTTAWEWRCNATELLGFNNSLFKVLRIRTR
mmetsp:Transcript_95386/g.267164  ORF Transcript_95386/g.267164 Transcript_95386/m.267164 type:complete len:234 (+) Transcript_95386:309-1010(+)